MLRVQGMVESNEIDLFSSLSSSCVWINRADRGTIKQPAMRNSIGLVVYETKFQEVSLSICINGCRLQYNWSRMNRFTQAD